MGGGPKPNSNVPIVDVPKWLWRGGVRPNWDNVLKYGFLLEASLSEKISVLTEIVGKGSVYYTNNIHLDYPYIKHFFSGAGCPWNHHLKFTRASK